MVGANVDEAILDSSLQIMSYAWTESVLHVLTSQSASKMENAVVYLFQIRPNLETSPWYNETYFDTGDVVEAGGDICCNRGPLPEK